MSRLFAGLLCTFARNFADSAEPLFERPTFIVAGLVVACLLLAGRALGALS